MAIHAFEIPGPPRGKARARTIYNKNLGRSQSYTPTDTMLYENLIRMTYKEKCAQRAEAGVPIDIMIIAAFEPPKSASKKKRELMLKGEILPTKKPDADNIAKVVLDALNGIAYHDDSQIVTLRIMKIYNEEPKLVVGIGWEEGEDDTMPDDP